MNILGFGRTAQRHACVYRTPNDKRPVTLIDDGYNSWRVVYADE